MNIEGEEAVAAVVADDLKRQLRAAKRRFAERRSQMEAIGLTTHEHDDDDDKSPDSPA